MFNNLRELIVSMPDEKTCREYLAKQRWPDGNIVCPYCGHGKGYVIEGGERFKCASNTCYKRFRVTVGTIMEASKIPVSKWLTAIYLVTAHKKGISSYQLGRDLGIAQKNSWFMLHRIREMLRIKSNTKVDNVVEIDEVYIGGKVPNMSKSKRKKLREEQNTYNTKSMVMGILERGGELKLIPITNNSLEMQRTIRQNVDNKADIITDKHTSYTHLDKEYSSHETVNHQAQEYVREGNIHTNSIEGAFSLLKRSIIGIYHQVTPKHLARYCDETMYRYNLRKMTDADRFRITLNNIEGRLTYKELINTPTIEKSNTKLEYGQVDAGLNAKIKGRPVYQLFDGEIVGSFKSIKEAAELTGLQAPLISRVLRGVKATTGGYQWIYA
jgi:transposase-like protein